ncbi:DMT family transporter [Mucilaginibacter pedocola]|uniref:Guanidinium exporter n=1 Tax=Mucilaginibacter pedocola TaxID=1792845 RepID=A0A1S9PFS6_9SPHI|nr:SMR family transporter [Mucilaginibacter pedocola]OOQ59806.1 hypothetical protein BC343_06570 [Mucilaginibacter pedocola]
MAWIYIIVAAIFETAWTYSVKFLKFDNFKTLAWVNFYKWDGGLPIIGPLVGYIIFGLANVYFFSLGIKELPIATAYAVWTAVTLVLIKITEVMFLSEPFSWKDTVFLLLIMTGIIGLKMQASS